MANSNSIDSTTQKYLDIHDVTNDLVILKDGTTSIILTVDAMNFGLLAEEEQDSIMYAYAGLLNSLNYPIQIIVRSQTKDVTGYLKLIKEQEDAVTDRTQQKRIMKYREFVSNLIRERNVLDKKFYISIPAKPLELGLVPVSSVLPGSSSTDVSTVDKSMLIDKARNILEPKRDHLIAQFARIGLYSRQLETQEIIQLFYQSYNPEAFEGQNMDDSKSYTAPLVSASIEGSTMNMQDQSQQSTQPQTQGQAPTQPVQEQPAQQQTQTQQQNNVSETGVPPQPPVNPGAMPQTPPEASTPTTNKPSMQPQSQTQTDQSSGYSPTQMPAQPTASSNPQTTQVPVANQSPETPQAPAQQPETNQNTNNSSQTQPANGTPLPPAPELPKTNPGESDPAVPKEEEITIQKPESGQAATQQTPIEQSQQPTQPAATPPAAQGGDQQNQEMAPLPEIK